MQRGNAKMHVIHSGKKEDAGAVGKEIKKVTLGIPKKKQV